VTGFFGEKSGKMFLKIFFKNIFPSNKSKFTKNTQKDSHSLFTQKLMNQKLDTEILSSLFTIMENPFKCLEERPKRE
jgi:hypothetical protein